MSDFLFVLVSLRPLRRIRAWSIDPKRRVARVSPMVAGVFLMFVLGIGGLNAAQDDPDRIVAELLVLVVGDGERRQQAITFIETEWQRDFTPMLLEVLSLSRDPAVAVKLIQLLEAKTGQQHRFDINKWYQWLWAQEPQVHPQYAHFKSALYGLIDPKFEGYFSGDRTMKIRLDEVRWGGVRQDGIPPLRNPKMISAGKAEYLDDANIIFGLEVNGDARAYPKRILAWHEMFVDDVGGVPVAGVYCTLCGTMILYKTVHKGVDHKLGTSGFLYRSNKLMYDQETQSLWNTIWGRPVIGPLADKDITLERMSVVTTTWGEWRRRHPNSKVLSLDTGYQRDYGEGVAYQEYFATDELMFQVPKLDTRLKNKDEVLGLIFAQHPEKPLAIAASYLTKNTVHHDRVGDLRFVVLTDKSGANRVYEAKDVTFKTWDFDRTVMDKKGVSWNLDEAQLKASDGRVLYRLPAHRAFWFGWYSAYTHTRLVQ